MPAAWRATVLAAVVLAAAWPARAGAGPTSAVVAEILGKTVTLADLDERGPAGAEGRIAFQQAGWEPVDAYRTLLERYEARQAFVVRDPAFRAAVYAYFRHHFVYADESRAHFYFEKPYWERTEAELQASGFR